MFVSILPFVAI